MQISIKLIVAVLLFVAFSIGLNLGLHGIIVFDTKTTPVVAMSGDMNTLKDHMNLHTSIVKTSQVASVVTEINHDVIHTESSVSSAQIVSQLPAEDALTVKLSSVKQVVDNHIKERAKNLSGLDGTSPLSTDFQQRIPIVLLTCNRPQLLKETIASLLTVKGISREQVLISQDGAMKEVAKIARDSGMALIQNAESSARLRGSDGGARIAQHYKYSLSAAFDRYPDAPALIVVEDDLLFSPDLYEYFQAAAPALDADPSTFVVSAWNDNGFRGRVRDPFALRRTDYFPGLGWLLTRRLYKSELEQAWPREHWDHWLRSPAVNRNREIVYPEVPRTFHNGIKGTFMNLETHNRYFRDIDYNTRPDLAWPKSPSDGGGSGPVFLQADSAVYEARVAQLLKSCRHVSSAAELVAMTGEIVCVWIDVDPLSERSPPPFEPIARFFGLWHEHRRGSHRGMHEFHWEGNYVLLINTHSSSNGGRSRDRADPVLSYGYLRPPAVAVISPTAFDKGLLLEARRRRTQLDVHKAPAAGMTCDAVCQAAGKSCNAEHLQLLNSCEVMREQFGCSGGCRTSKGADQPAFVSPDAPREYGPGECVVNGRPEESSCAASHHATVRLCACS